MSKRVEGRSMHRERDRNSRSRFVITETEAWFMRVEEGSPDLFEMLVAAVGLDLLDNSEIEATDAKLEDGRIMVGYAHGRTVEIRGSLDAPYPNVLRRIKSVFGDVRVTAPGWIIDTGRRR